MSFSLLLMAPAAFATHPPVDPDVGTCGPNVQSTYEMVDYNAHSSNQTHRTIWAPNLFCDGQRALFSAKPGNTLVVNPADHPDTNVSNPGSTGTFTGQFELVAGANCTDSLASHGTVWDVSYTITNADMNTGPKGSRNDPTQYQLGLVTNGSIKNDHLDLEVKFSNKPTNLQYGHQVGLGANDKETNEFGGAFWFVWDLFDNATHPATLLDGGHGDFNFDLVCLNSPSCPTDGGLGPAAPYNVYTCEEFYGRYSDIGGRAAIGDYMDVIGFGIGTATTPGSTPILSVGGDLWFSNGQIYNGDGEVGGTCHTSSLGVPDGTLTCHDPYAFDASDACDDNSLCDIANFLSSQTDTGCTVTYNMWSGQVDIATTGDYASCTLNLDMARGIFKPWVSVINGITVSGQHGATVIINVEGSSDLWGQNGSFNLNGGLQNDTVLWNFGCNGYCPSEIKNVSVQGSLLAPSCHMTFNNGHIDGQYIVGSHSGSGEFHNVSFGGDICPPAGN
ncbi:MAG: collagen-binding domain-containing protein [Myxococcota bacterium]